MLRDHSTPLAVLDDHTELDNRRRVWTAGRTLRQPPAIRSAEQLGFVECVAGGRKEDGGQRHPRRQCPTGLHDMPLSGTIRFVTDHGRRTYRARATYGRWKVALPPGDYVVEGRSEQISGGRHWSQPTRLFVRAGRVKSTVIVMYGTVR